MAEFIVNIKGEYSKTVEANSIRTMEAVTQLIDKNDDVVLVVPHSELMSITKSDAKKEDL